MRRFFGLTVALAAIVACADAKKGLEPVARVVSASATSPTPASSEVAAPASSAQVEDAAASPSKSSDEGSYVSTTNLLSPIFERPTTDSPRVGTLRVGARIVRSDKPASGARCPGGSWWGVEPRGFVCEGHEGVTLHLDDPAVAAAASMPKARTTEPFPYGYATSYGSPLYVRVPTVEEQAKIEGDVAEHVAAISKIHNKMSPTRRPPVSARDVAAMPPFLADHAMSPHLLEANLAKSALIAGHAWPGMRLSILTAFDHEGRVFYVTSEHLVVPADRMRAAKLADFQGVELAEPGKEGDALPLAWVNWKPAQLFRFDENAVRVTSEHLPVQAHVTLTGREITRGQVRYLEIARAPKEAEDADWRYLVRATDAFRLDAEKELPWGVGSDDLWIDVSIGRQTLVLYRGLVPIYATLVSTGVDGVGDPETTHSTPRGIYRILSKHLTARMHADEKPAAKDGDKPDPRYRIDDVPYVQYFHAGYAFHAAYWHDAFGQPKSHGCINLSPRDALWLFEHTTPHVPEGWHGVHTVRTGKGSEDVGTWVRIRAY